MKKYRVFVYGSLKKGFSNHYLLQDQTYLGSTVTRLNHFDMHHLGRYPGVTLGGNKHIQGEVYEIDEACLRQLDDLENNGVEYTRDKIDLMNFESVWMYFYKQNIPSNDFSLSNFYLVSHPLESNQDRHYMSWALSC